MNQIELPSQFSKSRRDLEESDEDKLTAQNLRMLNNPFTTLLECAEWCEQECGSSSPPRDVRTRDTHRKKKMKIKSLEQRRQELSKERLILERQILSTEIENKTLKSEIRFLTTLLEKGNWSSRNQKEATSPICTASREPEMPRRSASEDPNFPRRSSWCSVNPRLTTSSDPPIQTPSSPRTSGLLPSVSEFALSATGMNWESKFPPKASLPRLAALTPSVASHTEGFDFSQAFSLSLAALAESSKKREEPEPSSDSDSCDSPAFKLPCLQPPLHYPRHSFSIQPLGMS